MIGLMAAAGNMVIPPVLIVTLCALAGIGTVLLLPGRREGSIRGIGGAIVVMAAAVFAATLIRLAAGRGDPMGVYFWIFAGMALFGALRVVTHRRPVYSALYFILTVFASAGLFVLLWAEFMAVALVLIYAGAILVTYVFVIMLAARAGDGGELAECDQVSRDPLAATGVGFGLMALLLFVIFDKAPTAASEAVASPGTHDITVRGVAMYLFRNQLVNLELAGVLLTLAMVGAIVIARRRMWQAQEPEVGPMTHEIGDDNPHSLPVEGTSNPRHKAYPET